MVFFKIAEAAEKYQQVVPNGAPSWLEHFDLVKAVMIASMLVIVWFAKKAFSDVTDTLKDHAEQIKGISRALARLQGSHDARVEVGTSCHAHRRSTDIEHDEIE